VARRREPKRKPAAKGHAKLLAALKADPTDAHWEAAADQIERYRRAGEQGAALALVRQVKGFATSPERSKRLALEGALAAFGAGHDEDARAWARGVPAVEALMQPALDAVAPEPRAHATPRKRGAAGRKALVQAAAAVVATREGDPATARRRLGALRPPWRRFLDVDAHRAAVTIAAQTRWSGHEASWLVRQDRNPAAAALAVDELSAHAPEAAARIAKGYGVASADLLHARFLAVKDPRAAAMYLAERGPLPPGDHVWHLYRLFASVGDRQGFERLVGDAERAGLSTSELMRARVIQAIDQADAKPGRRSVDVVATRAVALADLYEEESGGTLLAGAARMLAAHILKQAGRSVDARRWLERVRDGGSARLRALAAKQMVFLDVDVGDLKRAAVESAVQCELYPTDVELWRVRLMALGELGRQDEVVAVLRQAVKATADPGFTKTLRRYQLKEGEVEPFDGMVPGMSTPGAIANEMLDTVDLRDTDMRPGHVRMRDLLERAAPLSRRLAPEGRAAVKMAALSLCEEVDQTADLLLEHVLEGVDDLDELRHLAAAYNRHLGGFPDWVVERWVERGAVEKAVPLLVAFAEAGETKGVGRWIKRLAAELDARQLDSLRVATEVRGKARPRVLRVEQLLSPDFHLDVPAAGLAPFEDDEPFDDDNPFDGDEDDDWGTRDPRAELEAFLADEGLGDMLSVFHADEMAELERLLQGLRPGMSLVSPPAVAFQLALHRILTAAMLRLDQPGTRRSPRKKPPRTSKARNKNKQKRRQRKKGRR